MKVVISEEQFRAESKKLAAHLADPEVEVKRLCFLNHVRLNNVPLPCY